MNNSPVDAWFIAKELRDDQRLDDLLAEDAVFVSPLRESRQVGRLAVKLNVAGIMKLLAEGEHRYVRQIVGPQDAMLEFESALDGLKLNGVEIIKWSDDGKITEIRVMLRPLDVAVIARDRMEKILLARKRAK